MDESTIFYAWQSDTNDKHNRYLIRDAIEIALKQLGRDETVEDCPRLDHDTKDVPGIPAIADTIFEKITKARIFLADATLIGQIGQKYVLNSNVAIELGYALGSVTANRIILVMNTAFGQPDELPFDLRHRRHPICYLLALNASTKEKTDARNGLTKELVNAIREILKIPEAKASIRNLKVRICPTRQGKRQLAQIQLFNSGPGPIQVDNWWIEWGDGRGRDSVSTIKGVLPVRLEEQASAELLVEIGDEVHDVSGFGVTDGDGHLWKVDENALVIFRHHAISNQLPPLPSEESSKELLKQCKINIEVRTNDDGNRKRLEVVFKNVSELPISIYDARLEWKYDPPREGPKIKGKPSMAQVSSSVVLSPCSQCKPIKSGEEVVFILEDSNSNLNVDLLRGDVRDEDISIYFVSKGCRWTGTMEEIPDTVKAVAQDVLKRLHA